MSVLIKGMNMPKNCRECKIKAWEERYNIYVCPFGGILELSCLANGRRDECPLVELPEKHGRLIDGDELFRHMNIAIAMMSGMMKAIGAEDDKEMQMELKAYRDIRDEIKDYPTVLEAEGTDEGSN